MKKQLVAVLLVLMMAMGAVAFAADPDRLVFVNVPSGTLEADLAEFQPILDHIEAVMGIPIEYKVVMDYAAVLQAMMDGWADMARLGPFQVVQAQDLFDGVVLACDIKSNTGEPFYYSLVLADPSLGIGIPGEYYPAFRWLTRQIDTAPRDLVWDITGNAIDAGAFIGHTIAFVEPTSASGYMAPMATLGNHAADFDEVLFAGSHAASIIALANGTVDVACTNEFRLLKGLETGDITPDQYTIVLWSDPIPGNGIVIRPGWSDEFVARLRDAWLTVPAEVAGIFKLDGFAPAVASDYDPMRALSEHVLED